ncbi:MAG TPA: hypothetical protein VH063_00070 [Gaiellaceae bacterium]|nr:hypothetical protein [Gaiellaceae bacterium]
MSEHEAAVVPETAVSEAAEQTVLFDTPGLALGAFGGQSGGVARIRRLNGGGGMTAPLARAALRGLGNAAAGRLLQRKQQFVKQPPTPDEKQRGEAGVRADTAKHTPLVSAARAKYDAKATSLIGGMKSDWAKNKADHIPEDVTKASAPKYATITEQDVRDAFTSAWSSVFSVPIPGHALGTLVGQWKAEGGKLGIADFNLGNLTLQTGPDGKPVAPDSDYRKRTAGEGQASGEKVPKTAFYAAFKTLEDGAIGLLHRLATGPNGGPALLAALIYGTREEYVFVLKSYKYFSGPVRNIVIKDRDGNDAIWWSGYLDSMASVPEVTVPPTPPPQPPGTEPPPGVDADAGADEPGGQSIDPSQTGPSSSEAPNSSNDPGGGGAPPSGSGASGAGGAPPSSDGGGGAGGAPPGSRDSGAEGGPPA